MFFHSKDNAMEWKSKNFFPQLQKNPYLCNPSKNLFRSKTMSEEINEEEKNLPQPDKGDSDDRIAGGVQNHLHLKSVSGMYRNWFIDYASYVILERAVPEIDDGLKPV